MQTAILLMTHFTNGMILGEYRKIVTAAGDRGPVLLLNCNENADFHSPEPWLKIHTFTKNDFEKLKYRALSKGIIPGSCHFPLMHFFMHQPDYDYYWLIEYDVRFSGNWRALFNYYQNNETDFLSCFIRPYSWRPQWYWWTSLNHPEKYIPLQERWRSFSPIYRISNRALKYLHTQLLHGWQGHSEVLMSTLLHQGGFTLEDLGGNGPFTPAISRNKFYIGGRNGTVRWRPVFNRIGSIRNKLYHPVK